MYYMLIDKSFKIIRKAKQLEWLKLDKDSGEFVFELSEKIIKATLIEIALKNKFKIDEGLTKKEYFGFLETQLNDLDGVDIMSEQPITQQAEDIIKSGYEAKKGKWIIIAELSTIEGINQAKLESIFSKTSIELGLVIDPKTVKSKIAEFFEAQNIKALDAYEQVEALIKKSVEAVKNADETMSMQVLRKTAKTLFGENKDWKFPKKSGGKSGVVAGGFNKAIIDFIKANPKLTKTELMAHMKTLTNSEGRLKNMGYLVSGIVDVFNAEHSKGYVEAKVEAVKENTVTKEATKKEAIKKAA